MSTNRTNVKQVGVGEALQLMRIEHCLDNNLDLETLGPLEPGVSFKEKFPREFEELERYRFEDGRYVND